MHQGMLQAMFLAEMKPMFVEKLLHLILRQVQAHMQAIQTKEAKMVV
jgi:hypothetical protein